MDEVAVICARLLREGAVPRAELVALDHTEVRADVERRLASVGLVLATSAYSDHVGLRSWRLAGLNTSTNSSRSARASGFCFSVWWMLVR